MNKIDWKEISKNPEQYEIRVGYYSGMVLTSEMLKCIRFDIEMKQHYKQEQDAYELLIHAIRLGLIK